MNYKDLLSELQDMKYWIEKEGMIATLDEAIARTEKAIEHLENTPVHDGRTLDEIAFGRRITEHGSNIPEGYDDNGQIN